MSGLTVRLGVEMSEMCTETLEPFTFMHCRVWIKLGWLQPVRSCFCHSRNRCTLSVLVHSQLDLSVSKWIDLTPFHLSKMTLENGQGEEMSSQLILSSSAVSFSFSEHWEVIETRIMTFLEYKLSKSANKRARHTERRRRREKSFTSMKFDLSLCITFVKWKLFTHNLQQLRPQYTIKYWLLTVIVNNKLNDLNKQNKLEFKFWSLSLFMLWSSFECSNEVARGLVIALCILLERSLKISKSSNSIQLVLDVLKSYHNIAVASSHWLIA